MRDIPLCNATLQCTKQAFQQGRRLDGRVLEEYREIKFLFPPTSCRREGCKGGTCLASLGNTKVLAKVSLEVTTPHPRKPSQGVLYVHLDKSFLPSGGASSLDTDHIRLQDILKQCLRDCIDSDTLCIVAGESVFSVRLELKILSNAGNVLDCAAMAALIALSTFRRPDVSLGVNRQVVIHHDWSQREPVPLTFKRFPFIITVGLLLGPGNHDHFVHDPTLTEEAALTGRLVVGINIHKELCCLQMLGSSPIAVGKILKAVHLVEKKVHGLHQIFRGALHAYDNHLLSHPRVEWHVPIVFSSLQMIQTEEFVFEKSPSPAAPDGVEMEMSEEDMPDYGDSIYKGAEVASKETPVWQPYSSSAYNLEKFNEEPTDANAYDPMNVVPVGNFQSDSEEEGEILEY